MAEPVPTIQLNEVNALGVADPSRYADPILITRRICNALAILTENGPTHLLERGPVLEWVEGKHTADGSAIADLTALYKFLSKEDNWNLYLDGITGKGFEIKRFRLAIEYNNGSILVLRESEDFDPIKRYTEELKTAYMKRGWIIRQTGPTRIALCRETRDASTGEMIEQVFSEIVISTCSARNRTPVNQQRYPSETDIRAEAQAR